MIYIVDAVTALFMLSLQRFWKQFRECIGANFVGTFSEENVINILFQKEEGMSGITHAVVWRIHARDAAYPSVA